MFLLFLAPIDISDNRDNIVPSIANCPSSGMLMAHEASHYTIVHDPCVPKTAGSTRNMYTSQQALRKVHIQCIFHNSFVGEHREIQCVQYRNVECTLLLYYPLYIVYNADIDIMCVSFTLFTCDYKMCFGATPGNAYKHAAYMCKPFPGEA